MRAAFVFLLLLLLSGTASRAQPPASSPVSPAQDAARERLAKETADDYADMQRRLGITAMRPGPSGNPAAPNAANTDESLLEEIQALYDAGYRGVELCMQSDNAAPDATYAYGSEMWTHKWNLMMNKLLDLDMAVYLTSGTNWATSNVPGLAIMADLAGKPIPEVGTTRFRPPFAPVSLGSIAADRFGDLRPERLTPMHDWHVAQGAEMMSAGLWFRPRMYAHPGETIEQAYVRETRATRNEAGIVDVSTRDPDLEDVFLKLTRAAA